MLEKRFIPLYLEHLSILIRKTGWRVTKIYSHYTFQQERFNRDYLIMNQKSRQNAKNNVEKTSSNF